MIRILFLLVFLGESICAAFADQPVVKYARMTISAATVTTTSSTLVTANSARKYLLIQNNSTTGIVYLCTDNPCTTAGIALASGASYEFSVAPTNPVYAIGSIASNTSVVVEDGK